MRQPRFQARLGFAIVICIIALVAVWARTRPIGKMTDTISANKAHFNQLAADYDSRFKETLERLDGELKSHKDFIAMRPGGRLLDYACGTGLLTNALSGQASECVGIDVSESMIEAYKAKASPSGPPRTAYLGNLVSDSGDASAGPLSSPELFGFDFAGVGLGFHHFDDPALAARRLAERLRPGGVLFIIDFVQHAPDAQAGAHGVRHHGFTEEGVRGLFEGAGAGGDFGFKTLAEPLVFRRTPEQGGDMVRTIFFARGTKLQ